MNDPVSLLGSLDWNDPANNVSLLARSLDLQKSNKKTHKLFITNIKDPVNILDVILSASFPLKDSTVQFILMGYCIEAALLYKCNLDNHVESIKSRVSSLLIMTKTAVPIHHIDPLLLFFQKYYTAEFYDTNVCKVAQVSFLRSPEVSIQVVNQITSHLDYDMTGLLTGQFCNILLAQFPSKNPKIRNDAFNLFDTLISKCSQDLSAVTESLLKALNQNSPLPEHRLLYLNLLKNIRCQKSAKIICDKLGFIVQKESSEAVLPIAISCFLKHLVASSPAIFGEFVLKGLHHEKPLYRRCVLTEINQIVNDAKYKLLVADKIVEEIYQILVSVQNLGMAVLDPKKDVRSIHEAYYAANIILACRGYPSSAQFIQDSSFLFQEHFYAKLNSVDEQVLLAQIIGRIFQSEALLFAVVPNIIYSDPCFVNFSKAIVWTLTGDLF